jgi:hypothetical protein
LGLLANLLRGLGVFPEVTCGKIFECLEWVPGPSSALGIPPNAESCWENGALRWRPAITIATKPKDERRNKENYSRQGVRQPVANILDEVSITPGHSSSILVTHLFSICHSDLTYESTDVNKKVEILRIKSMTV